MRVSTEELNNHAKQVLRVGLEQIGISGLFQTSVEMMFAKGPEPILTYGMVHRVEVPYSAMAATREMTKFLADDINKMLDSVLQSELVRGEISKLEEKIKLLEKQTDALIGERNELLKFKNHYELQYEIQQGKKRNESNGDSPKMV